MTNETFSKIIDGVFKLMAEANLSIGFVNGTGLGAILLAVIAVTFIRSKPFSRTRLSTLVRAWRSAKSQPPAE